MDLNRMYIVCYVPVFSTMIRAQGSTLEGSSKTSGTAIACWTHTAQNKYTQQIVATQLLIPTHAHFHWLKFIKNI